MTTVHIRAMTPADLDFAASCTAAEGWGSQRGEFEGFYAHAPEGCLVAETGSERIGICVATPYSEHGFLGMLIVCPEARGRGVGRRLLEHAIAYLHGRGVRSIYLDGALAAVPLYERLGFRKICRSLRFSGTLPGRAHPHVRPMVEADLSVVCALDRLAFGADRGFFLERRLAGDPALCKVLEQDGQIAGFMLGRRTEGLVSIGPWVARPEVKRPADLLESLAGEAGEAAIGLGVLETNRAAADTVRALGLAERAAPPWRMALGPSGASENPDALGASPLAYAVGSPAKG
jgi:GNAT superfamily N-acetyltransferase